ncbi:hypothetical protein HJC23_013895 [Cyclotella cryptica]|uniref:Phosphatidic acid phosphatase type 2/haloperoxidase domain-containing protein n=1 Tax=Cyclotella cryptica TaxID=29204 RepID=A0ABD3QNW2_9STRA|eukprot:CCRYP_005487-RA/>CCRYP_005487-RA protein AED:0.15 eAED:-0.14 QI:0/-1/0/1/-1/1/1/0/268
MTSHSPHDNEWVYSTIVTRRLKLTALNEVIHSIPSVSHPFEIFIFSCGYAFNPVMFPLWLCVIHALSRNSLEYGPLTTNKLSDMFWGKWREYLQTIHIEKAAWINTAFYFTSVLITLVFTELAKASFATTRPQSPLANTGTIISNQNGNSNSNNNAQQCVWTRRYGSLVSSLKSKHSFPSGDCAQAMNLCMFLYRYVPVSSPKTALLAFPIRDWLFFGLFLPGVAFARVFYWCHWIEDCIGGALLAFLLHWLFIPNIGKMMIEIIQYR